MAGFELVAAVDRLDCLSELLHWTARDAADWPAGLREAISAVADDLEHLAGEIDRDDDPQRLHRIIADAREFLPRNLADLGTAVADDLIREFRLAALASGGPGLRRGRSPRAPNRRRPAAAASR